MPNRSDSPVRRWASIIQTAEYLKITDHTVRDMVATGRLKAYRNGNRLIRLDLNEVDATFLPIGPQE
jgi:excisionase family DNA binding protein